MARILVTGAGGPAGKTVSSLLLARGHSVIAADARALDEHFLDARELGARSADARAVDAARLVFVQVPLASDPRFIEQLALVAGREGADILIPTVTEELPVVAEQWKSASDVPVMIGPADAVTTAHDKHLTCLRLSRLGVAVPRFRLPSEVRSADEVEAALGWPCLSKPRQGRGGRGVTVCGRQDWAAIQALGDSFILQEFLPGTDYGPNVFLPRVGGSGEVVVVLEKTRLKEGIVGNAAEVRRAEAADVAELARAAGRALGFVGPLDVDVRRGAAGRPAVLEINARFGANIACAPEVLDAALADWGVGTAGAGR